MEREIIKEENPNKGLYKCMDCKLIIKEEDLEDGYKCPNCHSDENLRDMCPRDKKSCNHDITGEIAFCPICGSPCCPVCGCEDVSQISRVKLVLVEAIRRVSGYLGEISGFNKGKVQEVKDRTRYDPITGKQLHKKL